MASLGHHAWLNMGWGDRIQVTMLVQQALYTLSHPPASYLVLYLLSSPALAHDAVVYFLSHGGDHSQGLALGERSALGGTAHHPLMCFVLQCEEP